MVIPLTLTEAASLVIRNEALRFVSLLSCEKRKIIIEHATAGSFRLLGNRPRLYKPIPRQIGWGEPFLCGAGSNLRTASFALVRLSPRALLYDPLHVRQRFLNLRPM